jgi:23S rRNA (pseudouridine1915-N3)-methyltransferase
VKLRVVAAGKLKEAGLREVVDEYVKRSRRFLPIEVSHVRDGAAVREALDAAASPRVILDERGEQPDTHALAQWLAQWRDGGVREVSLFVGDADGFSDAERTAADRVLSLSRLTLPHRLALVVLVEQLYRAATVLAGHPYHHE